MSFLLLKQRCQNTKGNSNTEDSWRKSPTRPEFFFIYRNHAYTVPVDARTELKLQKVVFIVAVYNTKYVIVNIVMVAALIWCQSNRW